MKINAAGLALIKEFEGWRSRPYLCPGGKPTIGWGSTRDVDGTRININHHDINEIDGQAMLDRALLTVHRAIGELVSVPLTENQFSALASWVYNLGAGNLRHSTLRKKLNMGDFEGAAQEFPRWCYAAGDILPGLVTRRAAEKALFMKGNEQ